MGTPKKCGLFFPLFIAFVLCGLEITTRLGFWFYLGSFVVPSAGDFSNRDIIEGWAVQKETSEYHWSWKIYLILE